MQLATPIYNEDKVVTNTHELVYNQVAGARALCPACRGFIFERWPLGWDAHVASLYVPSIKGKTQGCSAADRWSSDATIRKFRFKAKFWFLFRPASASHSIFTLVSGLVGPGPVSQRLRVEANALVIESYAGRVACQEHDLDDTRWTETSRTEHDAATWKEFYRQLCIADAFNWPDGELDRIVLDGGWKRLYLTLRGRNIFCHNTPDQFYDALRPLIGDTEFSS